MNKSFPLEDIVFENRNKTYGAYALRKAYSENMSKAMFICFSFISAFFYIGFWLSNKSDQPIIEEVMLPNILEDVVYEAKPANIEPAVFKNQNQDVADSQNNTVSINEPAIVPNHSSSTPINFYVTDSISNQTTTMTNGQTNSTDSGSGYPLFTSNNGNGMASGIDKGNTNSGVDEEVKSYVEIMPEFPGGLQALKKYLSSTIIYPDLAKSNGIEGKVVLKFVISKTGEIKEIRSIVSPNGALEKEAMRVVSAMPKWKPGKIGSTAVNVSFVLPIYFKLH